MPRRSRRERRRRAPERRRSHRKRGFTFVKGLQAFLMVAPAAAKAVNDAEANGGLMSKTGITRGLVPSLSTSYTGINTNDGKFYPEDMVIGYAPIALVAVASKLGFFRRLGRVFG